MTLNKSERVVAILLTAYSIVCLLTCSSCSVDKRATKKVSWLLAHDRLDDACARIYPVRDSLHQGDSTIHFDTLYVENDPEILHDTIYKIGDTIVRVIEKKCPPVQVITKTVHDSVFVYRSNTAEEERLKGVILDKEKQLTAKDDIVAKQQVKIDKNDWWKTACLITWFLVVLGAVFRIFIYKRPI